jgi:hypothetical protein
MLGHIQTQDSPERPQPKQPEVEGNARHQAKQGGDRHLKGWSFHESIMELDCESVKGLFRPSGGFGRVGMGIDFRKPDPTWTGNVAMGAPWQNLARLFTISSTGRLSRCFAIRMM